MFGVRIAGIYVPIQLKEYTLVDIKPKSVIYRGYIRVVNALLAQIQPVASKIHYIEVIPKDFS